MNKTKYAIEVGAENADVRRNEYHKRSPRSNTGIPSFLPMIRFVYYCPLVGNTRRRMAICLSLVN